MLKNTSAVNFLSDDERSRLRDMVQVFVAEKLWEAAGDLEMDDEIRVTIATQACLLILNLEHDLYRRVETIIVYPSTVVVPSREHSIFNSSLQLADSPMPILGQAIQHGPVILSWDAVVRGGIRPKDGSNVVYHEFAHKLDMLDGSADGVPPLATKEQYQQWIRVFSEAYESLERDNRLGHRTLLDDYALTNGAEFFAVATEVFFEQPALMRETYPEVYDVLREFFRQDPAASRRA